LQPPQDARAVVDRFRQRAVVELHVAAEQRRREARERGLQGLERLAMAARSGVVAERIRDVPGRRRSRDEHFLAEAESAAHRQLAAMAVAGGAGACLADTTPERERARHPERRERAG